MKRGKLLYVFKYPDHDVERDKHRNVITRARFIKDQLERAGYRLVPWDFKKGQPPRFWDDDTMEEDDDDLYGPSEPQQDAVKEEEPKQEDGESSGDEPMEEESGDDEEDEDSDSVRRLPPECAQLQLTKPRTSRSSSTSLLVQRNPHTSCSHLRNPKQLKSKHRRHSIPHNHSLLEQQQAPKCRSSQAPHTLPSSPRP